MKRTMLYVVLFGLIVLVAGCTLTEEQANEIATQAGEAAAMAVRIGGPAVGLSAEAAGGIAGAVGLIVSTVAGFILKNTAKKEIARVADTIPKQ